MMPQFVITYTHEPGCKCASCVDPESSQIFVCVGKGTRFPFDVMPTTTFGELKEEIVTYIEENAADIATDVLNVEEYDFTQTVDDVKAVNLIYVDDGTRNGTEIAHDTLIAYDTNYVIAGPISHGCLLTLDVDDITQNSTDIAFKVGLDPDYK